MITPYNSSNVYRNFKVEWLILRVINDSGGGISKRQLRLSVEKIYKRKYRAKLSQSIFSRVLKTMKHLALITESANGIVTTDCFFCSGRYLYNTVLTSSYLIGASTPSRELINNMIIYNPLRPYYKAIIIKNDAPSLESIAPESTKKDEPIVTKFLDFISIHALISVKNRMNKIGHIENLDKTFVEISDRKSATGSKDIVKLFENEKINTFSNLPQSALMENSDVFRSHNVIQTPLSLVNVILITKKAYDELVKGNLAKIEVYLPNGCGYARHNITRLIEPKGVKCLEIKLNELYKVRELLEYGEVGIVTESMFFTAELMRQYDLIPLLYLEPQYLVTDGDLPTRKVQLMHRTIEGLPFDTLSIYTSLTNLLSKESSIVGDIQLRYESSPAFLAAYNKFIDMIDSFRGE